MDSPFATYKITQENEDWDVYIDPALEKRKQYFYSHSFMPAPLKNYRSTSMDQNKEGRDKVMYSRNAGLLLARRKRVSFSLPLHKE